MNAASKIRTLRIFALVAACLVALALGCEEQPRTRSAQTPYEIDNRYASADPDLITQLQARLGALRSCVGAECRSAEGR